MVVFDVVRDRRGDCRRRLSNRRSSEVDWRIEVIESKTEDSVISVLEMHEHKPCCIPKFIRKFRPASKRSLTAARGQCESASSMTHCWLSSLHLNREFSVCSIFALSDQSSLHTSGTGIRQAYGHPVSRLPSLPYQSEHPRRSEDDVDRVNAISFTLTHRLAISVKNFRIIDT